MTRRNSDPTDYWKIESDFCVVDNHVAAVIGLNEAIVLRTIYTLCRTKKQNEGTAWWKGTHEHWMSKFPWLSKNSLKRVFLKLRDLGLLEIRIDKKTGNLFKPNREQIEKMLNDENFGMVEPKSESTDTDDAIDENEITQNGYMTTQNGYRSTQNGYMTTQIGYSLLSLDPKYPFYELSYDIATGEIPVATEPEVLPAIIEQPTPRKRGRPKNAIQPLHELQQTEAGEGTPSPITTAWRAYSEAFQGKYRVEPTRNARVMGQIKQFIERVGRDAPDILRFYLSCNERFYLQSGHSVGVALSQAEKLANGYRGAITLTESEAKRIDRQQTIKNEIDRAYERYEQEALRNDKKTDS